MSAMWFWGTAIWMVLFWVGVVVLAIWLAGLLFPRATEAPPAPRDILRLRYARGELTQAQYRDMLNELSS
ncbi:MAG: SHOCT domain-containing protein [Armatimonadetes bacterium]|nr:SHOCT domain-containing protein [Armatimonadota bacterium]